jgi:hypothetical protein
MARQGNGMTNPEPKQQPALARPKHTSDLIAERLRQLLRYSPETGRFYWRVSRGGVAAGTEAGSRSQTHGYRVIGIDGAFHLAHRLAWLYVHGRHPGEIDHINRNPTDNRIANLREISRRENSWNRAARGRSGIKGVRARGRNWLARITGNGKEIHLGSAKAAFQGAAMARQFLFDMARRREESNRKLTEPATGSLNEPV